MATLWDSQSPNEPSATNLSPARHWGRTLHTMKFNNCAGALLRYFESGMPWSALDNLRIDMGRPSRAHAQPCRFPGATGSAYDRSRPSASSTAEVLRRPSLARPHHNVPALDARYMQDDPVVLLVVDDAPWVALIRVVAVQASMVSPRAHRFQTANFRTLVLRPILAAQGNVQAVLSCG